MQELLWIGQLMPDLCNVDFILFAQTKIQLLGFNFQVMFHTTFLRDHLCAYQLPSTLVWCNVFALLFTSENVSCSFFHLGDYLHGIF